MLSFHLKTNWQREKWLNKVLQVPQQLIPTRCEILHLSLGQCYNLVKAMVKLEDIFHLTEIK